MKLKIVFPNGDDFLYTVDVMKYWEYTDEDLIKKKLYLLFPLQLFNLRKDIEKASKSNNINELKELSYQAKELATKLSYESKELFYTNALRGDDLHKMFLAITNLIEYLNNNYFHDDKLEDEVIKATKTLYDPEVEKKGKLDLLVKQLTRKLGPLPDIYIDKISKLPSDKFDIIAVDIFELSKLSDLDRYIQ